MSKRIFLLFAFVLLIGLPLLLGGCTQKTQEKSGTNTNSAGVKTNQVESGFLGDKGTKVEAGGNKILIAEEMVSDGNMHSFNYFSEKANKNIYFFIVKASDGSYRAAANACEVCHGSQKGFSQVGNLIRCENCRVTYSKDKIALEKGGCNPGPIDSKVAVEDGQLVLNISDVEAVAYLFK